MRPLLVLFSSCLLAAAIGRAQPADSSPAPSEPKPEDVLQPLHYSLVITATPLGPEIERRGTQVFEQTTGRSPPSMATTAAWAWSTSACASRCRSNGQRVGWEAATIRFVASSPIVRRSTTATRFSPTKVPIPTARSKPLDYSRHNVTGNYTWILEGNQRFGLKWNGGTNTFGSSGQIPTDEVAAGRLNRYGSLSAGDGGAVQSGRMDAYFSKEYGNQGILKLDGFTERSLFDLYSNFTFFLSDPVHGDGIQQHASRLSEGANPQYLRPHAIDRADSRHALLRRNGCGRGDPPVRRKLTANHRESPRLKPESGVRRMNWVATGGKRASAVPEPAFLLLLLRSFTEWRGYPS